MVRTRTDVLLHNGRSDGTIASVRPLRRSLIRARVVVAASTLVLVVTALPAFAGATLSSGATAQPGATGHQVTIALDPGPSATWRVQVTPPEGFVVEGCQPPEGWTCGVEGRTATYQTVLGELGPFGLALTVPSQPDSYPVTVRQSHATDAAATWTPTLTVVAPEPATSPRPTAPPDGDTEAPATDDPTPSPSAADEADEAAAGDAADDDTEDDGGTTTTPRRTQGRSAGSSFEVTPRRTAPSEAPADQPVVDQPAVASPSLATEDGTAQDDDEDGTAVAAGDGHGTSGSPSLPSLPWQQWVGALLLLPGAVVLVARQWGGQLASGGAAAVDRVRGVGSATLRRIPGPWGG